ncbi:MAG: flavodoxin family protein [bacterium]|nr:flavodoxin family protein [bacterium]
MNICIISGSPRKDGNSIQLKEMAASYFNEQGFETSSVLLHETNIGPCVHCDSCKKNDYCSKDDVANSANEVLSNADALLVISPVYFGSMTGQLKCMLDKTLPLRRNGFKLKGKIGAALAVGGSRNGGQELTIKDIHAWMLVHGMILVGDNNHFGGTVHNPLNEDSVGTKTAEGTLEAMKDILVRLNANA